MSRFGVKVGGGVKIRVKVNGGGGGQDCGQGWGRVKVRGSKEGVMVEGV